MTNIFKISPADAATSARRGKLSLHHGEVDTPAFMPVGTRGYVKTLTSEEVRATGAQIVLANAYHLYLRPGHEVVRDKGMIQKFTHFNGPVLTDSGGFQIFSLSHKTKVTDEGASFYSVYDGSKHFLSPESATAVQTAIGADIIMAFDECVAYESTEKQVKAAAERTTLWAKRSFEEHDRLDPARPWPQHLFGITQGGIIPELRVLSSRQIVELDLPGYAIGGLSVGEPLHEMLPMLEISDRELPRSKPRYLMGVGDPQSILEAVERGVDMFDCVHPTRIARNGTFFTRAGRKNLKRSENRDDDRPLDPNCSCFVCAEYSRSYLRHLFSFKEMLSLRLLSFHNLHFMQALMSDIRTAIENGTFQDLKKQFMDTYSAEDHADR